MILRLLLASIAAILYTNIIFAQEFISKSKEGVTIHYRVLSELERTVTVYGNRKMYKNTKELTIPEEVNYNGINYKVTEIAPKTFGDWNHIDGCGLQYISLPKTLKVIGKYAFSGNEINKVWLPEGLQTIGQNAFFDNYSVKTIYIPNSVRNMGKHVFGYSGAFTTVKSVKDVTIENLPPYITTSNCDYYGINSSAVERYYAYHPQTPQPKESTSQTVKLDVSEIQGEKRPTTTINQEKQSMPIIKAFSDVDKDIPTTTFENENTFAVIFANEKYQEEVAVEYAENDGEMFKEYCHKVLGLPEDNIHLRKNATKNNILAELSWMKKVADAYSGQARFIVFYAGHGIPDEKTGSAYLLPVDGIGTEPETAYSLEQFYKTLGSLPVANVTVFMDACFSGSKRGEGMLASARGVAMKAKTQAPQGKMVVFSAAQGDETAYPFKEKEHGLFTYYLLKKLKDTKGNVTYGELSTYLQTEVKRKSIVANNKSQTPTVNASQSVANSWKNMKLK